MPYAALAELFALAVASLVQPGRSAIRCVCPALRLTLAARFPGLFRLRLLLLIAGLALLRLLGSLLKLLLLLRCLLLTSLILLRALLGLLRLLGLLCLLALLFLGLLALGLLLGCLLLRGLPGLVLLALQLLLLLLLLIARLPLLILLGALLGLLILQLQLPLCLLLPRRLFLQGALANGIFGLPTLLLLLTHRVGLLALLVALKPLLFALCLLDGVASGLWSTWLHRQHRRIGVPVPQRLFAQCALPE